ncbi:MAG: cyclase family protein [Thermodesulfobacteriota bacterium]
MAGPLWDISLSLGAEEAVYPGDPPYRRRLAAALARGDACDLSELSLGAHAGTHLDAPAHFLAGGRSLDSYPPERFLTPAWLVEAPGGPALGPEALENLPPEAHGRALLFKTANSGQGLAAAGRWRDDYAHLSPALARRCLELDAPLVGVDAPSVEPPHAPGYPVHRLLLGADVLILEGLNLAGPEPGPYLLICPPLKLHQAEAAPARALLWSEAEAAPPGLDLHHTRLQAARAMAGAACHELNQPLQALFSQCEMLAAELEGRPDLAGPRGRLEAILDQVRRLAGVTNRFFRLVRYETMPYPGRQRIVDLARACAEPKEPHK